MDGGVVPVDASPIGNGFVGKITLSVIITCIVAASSGLLFGYDLGISGSFVFPPFLILLTACIYHMFLMKANANLALICDHNSFLKLLIYTSMIFAFKFSRIN